MTEPELSVVIPCLDEARTITQCVSEARDTMARLAIAGEVVVADNGSTDDSAARAEAAGARVVPAPVRGYGAAIQAGVRAARGRFVLTGDGDSSYDFTELALFIEPLRAGHRFVLGSRLGGTILPGAMPWSHRHLGTPALTWVTNRLYGTRISDCNCGIRAMERALFLSLGIDARGMEFASDMIVKAALAGVAIHEVPVTFRRDRRDRPPHLRPIRDGVRHLALILRHAPRRSPRPPAA